MEINIGQLFEEMKNRVLIDVRTPAEYKKGHIPGALNIPLFSDEERVEVGTAYKQKSPQEAMMMGLDYVGPKMRKFVEWAEKIASDKKVLLHCWRGGKRSKSMSWLLGFADFDSLTLEGGYKAYRNLVLKNFFQHPLQIMILSGYTGSGKTDILKALEKKGEQIIDLEGLANHKGSTFGAMGQEEQPQVEQFENDLYEVFRKIDPAKRVWVESESNSIGRVFIPDGFWQQMCAAPLVDVIIPRPVRVERLVKEYAAFSREDLAAAFSRIEKRLGGQNKKAAIEAMEAGDFALAADIGLIYYDKAYTRGRKKINRKVKFQLEINVDAPERTAEELIRFMGKSEGLV